MGGCLCVEAEHAVHSEARHRPFLLLLVGERESPTEKLIHILETEQDVEPKPTNSRVMHGTPKNGEIPACRTNSVRLDSRQTHMFKANMSHTPDTGWRPCCVMCIHGWASLFSAMALTRQNKRPFRASMSLWAQSGHSKHGSI